MVICAPDGQVSAKQLGFFQTEVAAATAANQPVVLLVHIPLYLEILDDDRRQAGLCGHPDWVWDRRRLAAFTL